MTWLLWMFYDFFAGLGALVFFVSIYVIAFKGGQIDNVSTAPTVLVPLIYSWLVGEIYRWPKEKAELKGKDDE